MDGIGIRRMSPVEMDAACALIGLAFAENPNTLVMAGGDRIRAQRMMQAVVRLAKLGRKYSHVVVAEEASSILGVLNAAEWPACQLTAIEKLKTASAMIRAMGFALPRAFKMTSVWAKHDPRERHWHLGRSVSIRSTRDEASERQSCDRSSRWWTSRDCRPIWRPTSTGTSLSTRPLAFASSLAPTSWAWTTVSCGAKAALGLGPHRRSHTRRRLLDTYDGTQRRDACSRRGVPPSRNLTG